MKIIEFGKPIEGCPELLPNLGRLRRLISYGRSLVDAGSNEEVIDLINHAESIGPLKAPKGMVFMARIGLRSRVSWCPENIDLMQVPIQRSARVIGDTLVPLDVSQKAIGNSDIKWNQDLCTVTLDIKSWQTSTPEITSLTPFRLDLGHTALLNLRVVEISRLQEVSGHLHPLSTPEQGAARQH